jgi:glycosyltransferase involved in cell wall biosynthesis
MTLPHSTSISVIIPTYKAGPYLRETLASVVEQTLRPQEIIVVDDCSPDNTCEIVEDFAAHAPLPVRLLRMPSNTGGPSGPMNTGVAAATCDTIAMIDHDDRMLPHKLERTVPLLAAEQTGLVFAQQGYINAQGELLPPYEKPYQQFPTTQHTFPAATALLDLLRVGYRYGGAGGTIFKKHIWEELKGFRTQYRVRWDYDFALRATAAGWDVGYLPEIVFQHRLHGSNLEQSEGGYRAVAESISIFETLLGELKLSSTEQQALLDRLALHYQIAANHHKKLGNYAETWKFYRYALGQSATRAWAIGAMLKFPLAWIKSCIIKK